MSRITDVLVAIDAETILLRYGTNSDTNAKQVADGHIYMVTNYDNAVSGQGGGSLSLKARVGDVIRWRETSLSLGFEHSVIFYKFHAFGGANLISDPKSHKATCKQPVPNPSNLLEPSFAMVDNYYWSAEVLNQGIVTYYFYFMILDRDGNKKGYYRWDPWIEIRG